MRLIGFVGVGHDRKNSAYWYFYGTRLYREDYVDSLWDKKSRIKNKRRRKRKREEKEEKEGEDSEDDSVHEENRESVWQVVCFTQQDWSRLVDKFRDSVIFFFSLNQLSNARLQIHSSQIYPSTFFSPDFSIL